LDLTIIIVVVGLHPGQSKNKIRPRGGDVTSTAKQYLFTYYQMRIEE